MHFSLGRKTEKEVIGDFSDYVESSVRKASLDEQLKIDVYPNMQTDLIYSPDYLSIQWNTRSMSVPIFEGMVTTDGKENVYLDKGVVRARGNLKVDTEYSTFDRKKSSKSQSPLYVMSTDGLKKLVVETRSHVLRERYVERGSGRSVRPETTDDVWPYIVKEFLNHSFEPHSLYIDKKEIVLKPAEINAIETLRRVNTKTPSVTVLKTKNADRFENFSFARPSSVDPNKAPLTISNGYEIEYRPYDRSKKRIVKKGKCNTLHLFPENDYVLPTIPLPARISKPSPETEIFPSKETEKIEMYFRGDERETDKRRVGRLELYPAPPSYIEIKDAGKFSFNVKEKRLHGEVTHSLVDTLEMLAVVPLFYLMIDLPLWPAVTFLPNGNGPAQAANYIQQFFNFNNILSPKDTLLAIGTAWNYASIGLCSVLGLGAFVGDTTYYTKRELTTKGDGLMKMKVVYSEHLPTIEDMKKTIDTAPKEDESIDVKNWAKEKRIK